jgi:cytoskeletal protein CcmA (bactofilin family)
MLMRLKDVVPETTVGEDVSVKGTLSYNRLLRIDGNFEGQLVSSGDLIVGAHGRLVGDVQNLTRIIVDGTIVGNITCEAMEIRAHVRQACYL